MAFFTRRGASSVPACPSNSNGNEKEISEEEANKYSYILDRDGVEV